MKINKDGIDFEGALLLHKVEHNIYYDKHGIKNINIKNLEIFQVKGKIKTLRKVWKRLNNKN